MQNFSPTSYNTKTLSFPVKLLSVYIVCTFFPLIYKYLPFLGTLRIVLVSGVALLSSYLLTRGDYANDGIYHNPIFTAMLGYLLSMILSIMTSVDRGRTLMSIEINFKYLLIIIPMINVIDNPKRIDFVMGLFALCGLGMAISTLFSRQAILEGMASRFSYRAIAIDSGVFADPNDLALLFNTAISYILYFFVKGYRKFVWLSFAGVTVTAVMFTYSRGGFLGLCVVACGFYWTYGQKRARILVPILAAAILFWSMAPNDYKNRIATIQDEATKNEETGKYDSRIDTWVVVFQKAMENPIGGDGAGCSSYTAGNSMSDWHLVHNTPLQVFSELGLPGFVFYILLHWLPLKQYRQFAAMKMQELEPHLARFRFLLLALFAFAATAFFLPQAYSPIFYTISALTLIQSHLCTRVIQLESRA